MSISVLVVDDSAPSRRLLVRAIEVDPQVQVVGTATSGEEALEMLDLITPDLMTLDLEMPGLDGLATLRLLRRRYPRLPVVVVSSLSEPGAAKAIEALAMGANDFVTKPQRVPSIAAGLEGLRSQLIPKIKALHGKSERARIRPAAAVPAARPEPVLPSAHGTPVRSAPAPAAAPGPAPVPAPARTATTAPAAPAAPAGRPATPAPAARTRRAAPTGPIEVIAIGSSTGGPQALETLLANIPASLSVPILIVQHMPPTFTRLLAERLDSVCQLTVREAYEGCPVVAGEVLIAPGDHHMVPVRRGGSVVIALNQGPQENHCRPAVDVLFRGVAETYDGNVLAAVLTGMGSDGLVGARILAAQGATIVAQDEESSVVWGMAGSVAGAGIASAVQSLGGLTSTLVRTAAARGPAAKHGPSPAGSTPAATRARSAS